MLNGTLPSVVLDRATSPGDTSYGRNLGVGRTLRIADRFVTPVPVTYVGNRIERFSGLVVQVVGRCACDWCRPRARAGKEARWVVRLPTGVLAASGLDHLFCVRAASLNVLAAAEGA